MVNMVQSHKSSDHRGVFCGSPRGRGGRGRGRGRNNGLRPTCQICGKNGHLASVCYYRTDMAYMGSCYSRTG